MSRFSQNTRTAYCRQPVQHVLLDIGYPMTPLHIKTTITALQNVLTLACSLRGGIRIPGFGVSVINKTFELIYWTDVLRGNFSKVLPALNSVESYEVSVPFLDPRLLMNSLAYLHLLDAFPD
ncbi:uncharacterized protein LOC124595509 [Schistocerca americana]|uniref:uncharacterized protein LOC124595509 n=1 Tax=Schistocerca americana TaxID=7009 RepID=UPI001F5015E9|nr:uncharacterized protein LOC124595509 [Schistocerca americana]